MDVKDEDSEMTLFEQKDKVKCSICSLKMYKPSYSQLCLEPHVLCQQCIKKWQKIQKQCAICRKSFKPQNIKLKQRLFIHNLTNYPKSMQKRILQNKECFNPFLEYKIIYDHNNSELCSKDQKTNKFKGLIQIQMKQNHFIWFIEKISFNMGESVHKLYSSQTFTLKHQFQCNQVFQLDVVVTFKDYFIGNHQQQFVIQIQPLDKEGKIKKDQIFVEQLQSLKPTPKYHLQRINLQMNKLFIKIKQKQNQDKRRKKNLIKTPIQQKMKYRCCL